MHGCVKLNSPGHTQPFKWKVTDFFWQDVTQHYLKRSICISLLPSSTVFYGILFFQIKHYSVDTWTQINFAKHPVCSVVHECELIIPYYQESSCEGVMPKGCGGFMTDHFSFTCSNLLVCRYVQSSLLLETAIFYPTHKNTQEVIWVMSRPLQW